VGSPPVILRSSAAGQVAWVRLANGKPGVYIPTGNIMGTELALPSRLLLRSVVFRWMHIFGPRPPAPSLEKKPASKPALWEVCCCGWHIASSGNAGHTADPGGLAARTGVGRVSDSHHVPGRERARGNDTARQR
jgi:hypothetical protein